MASGSMAGANKSLKNNRALRLKNSLFKGNTKKLLLTSDQETESGKDFSESGKTMNRRLKNSTLTRRTPLLKRLWGFLK